jgi:ribosomal protein L11 methyltransferase
MRELRLRVPAAAAEDVLDRLLPLVPGGVREVRDGGDVELRMRGDRLPTVAQVAGTAEGWPHRLSECEVPDDWRERRALDYVPDLIGGRLVARPEWAPAGADAELEIVIEAGTSAFGAGTHPTTRTCLEFLLELEPAGSFADLGAGTGVLAIVAYKLGWRPVVALDVDPDSVDAIAANAAANDVGIESAVADLATAASPPSDAFAANIPAWLHEPVARSIEAQARLALVSGFGPEQAPDVLAAYAARGFREQRRVERHGWVVALLDRD